MSNSSLQEKYNKIVDVILSCTDEEHLKTAGRMIDEFTDWCSKSKIDPKETKFQSASLTSFLNHRRNQIL